MMMTRMCGRALQRKRNSRLGFDSKSNLIMSSFPAYAAAWRGVQPSIGCNGSEHGFMDYIGGSQGIRVQSLGLY